MFKENHLRATTATHNTKRTDVEKRQNAIEWITFYRRNWHIFVDRVLEIKLRPFQQIKIYLMGISDVFFAICSRGLSKTFMAALAAVVKMLLFPYSEIVITASTISQANIIVEQKIRGELIKKLSPYLLDMYTKDYLIITKSDDGYKVECTLNGSTLRVLPQLESSRGHRSTYTIYEECRLLKKTMVDSVFDKMSHPRQAKYLENPEYSENPRWLEECKTVYITSARFKFEWFWRQFKNCFTGYFTDKKLHYNIFAGDIFMSISNGLKTWGDYRRSKKMSSEMDFRMEDLNEMVGEGENAFFSYKPFKENQVLENCFRPRTTLDVLLGKEVDFPEKEDDEIRLIISDFAFVGTTSNQKNDNTVIVCMSLHWKKYRFERHIDYIETVPGGHSLESANRIREIFWDYDCDYYIPDLRNGGEVIFNYISMPWEHPERGRSWNPAGFGLCNQEELHVIPKARQEELKSRIVDSNAIPCIIPMIGSGTLNSTMWIDLRKQLESNNIKFLVSNGAHQQTIEDNGKFYEMTSEQYAEEMLPYAQEDEMIQECVNLTAEYRDGLVHLFEPKSGFKDRAVCLNYGNHIASKFDNLYNKNAYDSEVNADDFELVF